MSASLPPALPSGHGSAIEPYAPPAATPAIYRGDAGEGEQPTGGELSRVLSALYRFKWLVLALLLVGLGGGALATRLLDPEYQVQSTVLLTSVQGTNQTRGPLRDDALLDAQGWQDLLKSYSIADSVVMKLALYLEPEKASDSVAFRGFQLNRQRFYPGEYTLEVNGPRYTLRDKIGIVNESGIVGDSIGRSLAGFLWRPTKAVLGDKRTIEFRVRTPRETSVDILKRLDVRLAEGSNLILLGLSGTPQQKPAETLNAWGEQFVRIAADLKTARLSQFVRILTAQRAEAEQRLRSAEMALTQFRVNTVALPSEGLAVKPAGLNGVEMRDPVFDQYFKDRYDLQAIQRDREALDRAAAAVTPENVPVEALLTIPAVATDPGAVTLRTSLDELVKRQAELRVLRERFTDSMKVVKDAMYGLQQLQTKTIPQHLAAFRSELVKREATMTGTIAKATSELQGIPSRSIQQEAYRRELDNATQLYLSLQARSADAELSEKSAIPDVRILDQAVMPLEPTKNTALPIFLVAIVGSLALGGALAVVLDRLDRRFRYPTQATKDLALQILGVVPIVEQGRRASAEKVANVVEAFRTLRMNVRYACMPNQKVTLAITSPGPGDGKSLVASNLALSFAEGGWRTVLIDADLRRGFLNETFDLQATPGLIEFLEGTSPLDEVLNPTHHANLMVMAGGTRHRRAPELLATPRMQELVAMLARSFDAIIIDTPPLGAGTDAYAIATATTNVAIVLRGGTTDVKVAKAKMETLDRLPVSVIGAILNGVETEDGVYQYYSYDASYSMAAVADGASEEREVARIGDGR
jgi:capsular exopolysaccharide synthesis family protein